MFVSLVQELERIIMAYADLMSDMEQELNHLKERAETLEREVIGLDYIELFYFLVFLLYAAHGM